MKKLIKRRDNYYILEHEKFPIIIFFSSLRNNVMDIYEKRRIRVFRKDQVVGIKLLSQSEYEFLLGLIENFRDTFDGKCFIINNLFFEFHKGRGLDTDTVSVDYTNQEERLIEIGQKYSKMSNIITSTINVYEKAN